MIVLLLSLLACAPPPGTPERIAFDAKQAEQHELWANIYQQRIYRVDYEDATCFVLDDTPDAFSCVPRASAGGP